MKKQEVTIKLVHSGERKTPVHMDISSSPKMDLQNFKVGDNMYIHDLLLQFAKTFTEYVKKQKLYD